MGEWIKLKASDGFELTAWRAAPQGAPKGGIVVIQEIFGVNHHIRAVADRFAAQGYLAIAPAVFDRVEPGVELKATTRTACSKGMGIARQDGPRKDPARHRRRRLRPPRRAARSASSASASAAPTPGPRRRSCRASPRRSAITAARSSPSRICSRKVPTMLHFGEKDEHIPIAGVNEVGEAAPGRADLHVYPAGHGFNCDERGSYDAPSAKLAWERTLAFFAQHVG